MPLSWRPSIQKGNKPLYLILSHALADDIGSGALSQGTRLPTQRELADDLGIAIGTVTRAYEEAEKRGLIYANGRRGTFVGERPRLRRLLSSLNRSVSVGIDLSRNHPSHRLDPELPPVLHRIARESDCAQLLTYPPPAGLTTHREAGASWMTELGMPANPDDVFVTAGAQNAVMAVFAAETRAGDVVATEEYAYPGIKAVADTLGLQLEGVTIDEEGIVPEALDEVCRNRDVRLIYCNPSLQNPTNAVMSLKRRQDIAAVVEKHNLRVVEDEILSPLLDQRPGFLTGIIPERSFFVISSSKTVAAGLRVGFVAAPRETQQRLLESLQAISLGQPQLMAEVFAQWYEDGTVKKAIAARKRELAWGQDLACEILGSVRLNSHPSSYHLWLHLPDSWTAIDFTREALMRGVSVAPADLFAVERKPTVNAVRLSIGSPSSRELLRTGLEILAGILAGTKRADTVKV